MKTCPWNLEGLFSDAAFRWMAIHAPGSAKTLARLDDQLGRGEINPVKAWWWDIELDTKQGRYVKAEATNRRGLSRDLDLKYEDQTLAVYPADVMPPAAAGCPSAQPGRGDRPLQGMLTPEPIPKKNRGW